MKIIDYFRYDKYFSLNIIRILRYTQLLLDHLEDLEDGEDIAYCPSCSLKIKVLDIPLGGVTAGLEQ